MIHRFSWSPARSAVARYGFAVATSFLALIVARSLTIAPTLIAPFLVAVVVTSWFGGLGPGLLSVAIGLFAGYFYILPDQSLGPISTIDAWRLAVFALIGTLNCILTDSLRRHRDRAEAAAAANERLRAEAESSAIEREEAVTEAEESARQQAETLALLDSVLSSAPVGLAFLDRDLRFVRINDALAQLHGLAPPAILGKTLAGVLPGWAPAIAPLLRQVLDTGHAVMNRELSGGTPAGRAYEALVNFYPVRSALGEIAWVGMTLVDITARKHAESVLRESEARFHNLADTAPVLIWMAGPDTLWDYCNRPWLEFTGRTLDQELGNGWTEAIHPDDRARCIDTYQAAFDARQPFELEYRHRRHDGVDRWLFSRGVPRHASDGTFLGYIGGAIDIHDRREAEAELRLRQQLLRLAQRAARAGIWSWDLGTGQVTWSPEFREIFGFAADLPPSYEASMAAIYPEDRDGVEAASREAAAGAVDLDIEFRVLRDGDLRWINARGRVVEDVAGRASAMVGICLDVTDRKRNEQQFWQAQKMEAVGRVAGGVAHEINNMMTVILGFSEFLEQQLGPNARAGADVREIRRAAERSAGITRQLLAYSRRALVQPQVLDLNRVVSEMGNILRRLLGEPSALAVDLARGLHRVRVDRGQIEQVMINLALNARDAMPHGGRLTVTTQNILLDRDAQQRYGEAGLRAGGYVMLAFSDTGTGMPPDVMARLFEPFFTTKPPGQGTGLGLATVYGIVTQSEGDVWVDSEVGHGTVVKVLLPAAAVGEAEGPRGPGPEAARTSGEEVVLVVEDEEPVRRMACRALEADGYRVLEAPNGVAALDLLERSGRINLLITDVFMPGIGGRELADAVRARYGSVAVMFMSGYTDDDIIRRGLVDLDAPFLQKPFSPDTLAAKVREVLDGKGGQQRPATIP